MCALARHEGAVLAFSSLPLLGAGDEVEELVDGDVDAGLCRRAMVRGRQVVCVGGWKVGHAGGGGDVERGQAGGAVSGPGGTVGQRADESGGGRGARCAVEMLCADGVATVEGGGLVQEEVAAGALEQGLVRFEHGRWQVVAVRVVVWDVGVVAVVVGECNLS